MVNRIELVKKFIFKSFHLVFLLLVPPLFVIKYLFNIQLVRIRDGKIGHLAGDTDFFLRRRELEPSKNKKIKLVGIASKKPGNEQLLKMFKRRMSIIQIPQPKLVKIFLKAMSKNSILERYGLFIPTHNNKTSQENKYYEFTHGKASLEFTPQEEEKGKELLEEMNVRNWFVCFHARDSAYVNSQSKEGDSYHSFRNFDINNFGDAVNYLANCGGHALRMGSKVEKEFNILKNDKIVDYATHHRSDFGDIYLSKKCKFFLGGVSGINQVPQILDVPMAATNIIPLNDPPWSPRDIFIPKKIWDKKEKKFLSFDKMFNFEFRSYRTSLDYEKAGLIPIENTPEEILDLAMEMNQRLDGTWETMEEDEELQRKLKLIPNQNSYCYGFSSRMGAKFLRANKELLE